MADGANDNGVPWLVDVDEIWEHKCEGAIFSAAEGL